MSEVGDGDALCMVTPVMRFGPVFSLCVATLCGAGAACGGAPERASSPAHEQAPATVHAQVETSDLCEPEPGKPPAEPLERAYTGLAAKARCQNEVESIMNGVAEDLGVSCSYCHASGDFRAPTPRKDVANWMATRLAPALRKHDGSAPRCSDCHTANGHGVAKILGEPRRESFAAEWMTTHLVEDFETSGGAALHCKSCHHGNLGSAEFQPKIILTNNLPDAR